MPPSVIATARPASANCLRPTRALLVISAAVAERSIAMVLIFVSIGCERITLSVQGRGRLDVSRRFGCGAAGWRWRVCGLAAGPAAERKPGGTSGRPLV